MDATLACMCNSRMVIPESGEASSGPLYLLWVAQVALIVVAAALVVRRSRSRRAAVPAVGADDAVDA